MLWIFPKNAKTWGLRKWATLKSSKSNERLLFLEIFVPQRNSIKAVGGNRRKTLFVFIFGNSYLKHIKEAVQKNCFLGIFPKPVPPPPQYI